MSERSTDLDQELQNIKARDRERKQAQDARAAEEQRKEQRQFRIERAIDSLRRIGPLDDQTVDEVWLDRLAELREALIDAGKAELLDELPETGVARHITRRCIELLAAGRRPEALALFDGITAKGELDAELANEQSFYLPNDLCELLGLPTPQSPTLPAPSPESGGERSPEPQDGSDATADRTEVDKITQAIALKQKHPDWTAKRIAEAVGCSEPNLSQSPRWQFVVQAVRDAGRQEVRREGNDPRGKDRGGKRREGKDRKTAKRDHDMDDYADEAEEQARTASAAWPKCASCDDPAGADSEGEPLTHDGKPRCSQCWTELSGWEAP
jgi:hypothetical protein